MTTFNPERHVPPEASKVCARCSHTFTAEDVRPPSFSFTYLCQWERRRYCSNACAQADRADARNALHGNPMDDPAVRERLRGLRVPIEVTAAREMARDLATAERRQGFYLREFGTWCIRMKVKRVREQMRYTPPPPNPRQPPTPGLTMEERYWAKVDVRGADECWPWLGCIRSSGYGGFVGRQAHRFGYQLVHGPVPDTHDVHHTCRQRHCQNPTHLLALPHDDHSALTARTYRQAGATMATVVS